jgi:hypothetical protein
VPVRSTDEANCTYARRERRQEVIVRTARLQLTGERTVPGISHENYWFTVT